MADKYKKPTIYLKKPEQPLWFLINAEGKTLGRLASEIAKTLRGKNRPRYTPHVDSGDGVIVINAEKVRVSGRKASQKMYYDYSGHVGGLKETPYAVMIERKPDEIVRRAVWGMMAKTKQSRKQMKRLRVYRGKEHGMQSQNPVMVNC